MIRTWLPILRPFSSPLSTADSTSETSTPRRSATCSGVSTSGALAAARSRAGKRRRHHAGGRGLLRAHVPHHLLRHGESHRHLSRRAGRAAALRHALPHLILHVVVEVADHAHSRPLVDCLLDFRRHRHVLKKKTGHLDAVFSAHLWIDGRQQRLAQLAIAAGHIESRNFRSGQRIAEHADHARAHRIGKLVDAEILIRPDDFLEEELGVYHFEIEGAEGPQPHDAKVLVSHHHGVRCAPLVAREQPGRDIIDVHLEGRDEAVFPTLKAREHRDIGRAERVFALPKECRQTVRS